MISVYHLDPETCLDRCGDFLTIEGHVAQAQLDWQTRKYELVADVLGNDLQLAFQLTNTINRPWWHNADVTPRSSGRCRSTSIGDLMVTDNGAAFLVMPTGFFAAVELPEQIEGGR